MPSKRKPAAPKGRPEQARGYYFPVAGVTFEGRQRLIKRHCREGDRVWLEWDSDNEHSRNAVGVWVNRRGWFAWGRVMVGYVPEENSAEICGLLRRGWSAEGSIRHVVGGGLFRSRGLRIQAELRPGDAVCT